ncbi:MAG TPA: CSLREA domain-containing protein, partial [Blastocatellia bacterium]
MPRRKLVTSWFTHKMIGLLLLAISFAGWGAQARRHAAPVPAVTAAPAALLTTISVNSTADGTLANLALNATCDLREAIEAANTNAAVGQCPAGMAGLDTIGFAPGVTGTIT